MRVPGGKRVVKQRGQLRVYSNDKVVLAVTAEERQIDLGKALECKGGLGSEKKVERTEEENVRKFLRE